MKSHVTLSSPDGAVQASLNVPEGRDLPALIVCHGAGEFKENYAELCDYLAGRGVASLALDLYGHGESDGERHCIDIGRWVGDIVLACDYLESRPEIGRGKLAAFGLSSGGTAVLEAALREPRLGAIVALDATVRNSLGLGATLSLGLLTALGWVKRLVSGSEWRVPWSDWLGETETIADPAIRARVSGDPRSREMVESYPLPGGAPSFFVHTIRRAGAIRAPTLVLWGAEDRLDSPETARRLYAALRCEKELAIVPGNGHMGHLDANRLEVFERSADWVLRHLGPGRS